MAAPYSPLPTMADDYVDAPRARRLDDDGDAVDSPPVKHTQMDDDNDEEEAIELEDLEAINEDDILLRSQSRDQDDRPKPTRHQRKPTADDPASIVAKVVPATDDTTLTTLTIRVFLIGCVLGGIGSAISQIAYFKSNSFGLSGFFIILVSYPMGHGLARYVPPYQVSLFGRLSFNLNPGPFSVKEHLLVGVLAGCASSAAYAGDIVAVQDLYYHQDMGHLGGLLLLLSTQLFGFALAGLAYSILIRPTAMIWPSQLVVITLYNTLHSGGTGVERALTHQRLRYFSIVFLGIFTYQFLPAVIAPILTSIAVLCLIDNGSTAMRMLGSAYTGAGLLTFSLDWSVIGGTAPLYTPFFASCSFCAGILSSMWILVPALYFTNTWNAKSFGYYTVSARLYDQNFERYNVSSVVRPDFTLDEEKFAALGPIQLTPFFAVSYGIGFALLTSAITTVVLFHWDDVRSAIAARNQTSSDPHVELVERNYGNIPGTWYIILGAGTFLAALYTVLFYPLQLPVWGLLLALSMATVFIIPIGIIKATTNTAIGLNIITEFVAGLLLPGRPIANITFKVWGYMTMSQCLDLCSDLKLGIYAKIPPKDMFIAQCTGTSIGAVINYVFIRSVIHAKRDMLDGTFPDPTGQWTGRKPEIFYSASVIWGLIGPIRFFSGKYRILFWGFPLGAILPFIPWLLRKRFPRSRIPWTKISVPLFLHAAILPPAVPSNIALVGFLAAFSSQYYAFYYHPRWFEKYNYILSAGLDSGTSINALVVYLLGLSFPHWWGNSAIDAEHCKPGS